ncbi:MAG: translocation/assembly module TamB domain-containing protein [Candidatus Eiseniibacteriota bacterium]|nr:MAG: translocation/assembly module TamB domain-containing protein [Candidatus Eisenbacteria bacterium]
MVRRALRITVFALALLVTVVLLVAIFLWQTRQAAVAKRVERIVQEFLVANDSTRIEMSRISGNPLGSLTIHDARLLVRDGEEWRSFVEAKRVTLEYKLSQLSRRAFRLSSVEFAEPVVSFSRGETGDFLWPRFGDGAKKQGKGEAFLFAVERFRVANGELRIEGEDEGLVMENVSLEGAFRSGNDGVSMENFSLAFFATPLQLRVERSTGTLRFFEENLTAEDVEVRTSGSTLSLDGRSSVRAEGPIDLQAVLNRFSLSEVRGFQMLSFLPEAGEVAGTVRVTREEGGPLGIGSSLRGTYGAHAIESLDIASTADGGRWANKFRLKSDESLFEGTFDLGPGESQVVSIDFMNFDPGNWSDLLALPNVPRGALSGRFTFSGRRLGAPDREGEVGVFLDGGRYAGVSFTEATATGSVEAGELTLSSLDVKGAGYGASGTGSVGGEGEIDLLLSVWLKKLSEFESLGDAFDLDGLLTGGLRLSGSAEALDVELELAGSIDRTAPPVASGTVRQMYVRGSLLPSVSLHGRGVMDPAKVFGIELDSLVLQSALTAGGNGHEPGEAQEGEVCGPVRALLEATVEGAGRDTAFAAEAAVLFCEEGMDVGIDRLKVALDGLEWRNEGAVRLSWRRGIMEVKDLGLYAGESRVAARGSYEPGAGRLAGNVDLDSLDIEKALGGRLGLGGSVLGRIAFERHGDGLVVDADIDWLGARVAERAVDGISLIGAASGRDVVLEHLELRKGGGDLRASGTLTLSSDLLEFLDTLRARGSMPPGVRADLGVAVSGLDLSEFSEWHPALAGIGGVVDGKAKLEGYLENPGAAVDLKAQNLRLKEYRLAGLSADVVLKDGVCTVSQIQLLEQDARGEVNGFFPAALDLSSGGLSFPDAPMRLTVRLSESDFSVATLFLKQLGSCSGLTRGEAELSGTFRNPRLRGGFELKNATLRLAGREETLEDLDAQVTLSEEAIELVKCTARLDRGRFEGSGKFYLSEERRGEYEFLIRGKKVTAGDPEDIAVRGDFVLDISSVEVKDRGKYAQITGKVDLRQGLIAREFQASSGPPQEQRWFCDIEVEIPNNLWLKNTNAEIELAGSLTARQDMSGLILLGSLRILRGKYYVFDNEFRITSGTLEFKDVGAIDPEMSIEAETRTSGRRVFLTLSGRLSEPNIRFSSEDPNLSHTEIVRLLTVGKYVAVEQGEGVEGGLVPGVTGSVGNYFLRQIERRLAREVRWVDSIEFGSGLEGTGSLSGVRWGVGKYITPELYLRYSQGLTRTSERDVSVEYRLSELLFLRGEVVSRDRFTGSERDKYNLDLKLKYEY